MYEELVENADIKTLNIIANNLVMHLMETIIKSNDILLSHNILNKFISYDTMKTEYMKVINSFSIYVKEMDDLGFDMTAQNLLPFLDILYPFRKILRESGHLQKLLNLKLLIADFGISGKALLKDFLGISSNDTFDNALTNYTSYLGTFQLLEPFDITSYIKLKEVSNVFNISIDYDLNHKHNEGLCTYMVTNILCMGSNKTRVVSLTHHAVLNYWKYFNAFALFIRD